MTNVWTSVSAALLAACGLWLLAGRGWRSTLTALGLQYAAAAFLVAQMWPPRMALVKALAGWGAVLIVFSTVAAHPQEETGTAGWSETIFRLTAGGLVLLAVVSLLPDLLQAVPGIQPATLLAAAWLMGSGLLQLGFTLHPPRVVVGWLTVLTGFEIAYAAVERSLLIAALLAGLHIALALVGVSLPSAEATE